MHKHIGHEFGTGIGTGKSIGARPPRPAAVPGRHAPRRHRRRPGRAGLAVVMALLLWAAPCPPLAAIEYTGITRDTFPVFNDPRMLTARQAEAKRLIFPRSAVIGVTHGKAAKAYPIAVMGIHELGNDTIDGIPIAVSW